MIRLDSRIALQDTKKRSLDKSLFFQRLKDIIGKHRNNEELKNELENIQKTVKTVVKNGSIISQRIIEILPHFTLHNETHFFNVLAFMEQLVPESTMDKLCAVECALAILSAFTHDIAMAISLEEKNKITGLAGKECDEHKAFLDFCNGRKKLLEVKEQLENRLLSSSSKEDIVWRIEALKQRLLGDYIRSTHSHEEIGFNRIHKCLDALEKDNPITFTYNRLDLKPLLCFLDVSHGQSMNWIEEAMVKKGYKKNDVYEMHSTDGTVNLAYLSWILHLADLLDCDSSRTPPVIYHHIGITDHVSKEHWEKHLSVHTIDFRKKKETGNVNLVFISHSCSGPIIHKMILDHVNYVNYQLNEIRTAMHTAPYGDKEKYMLNLPVRAGSDIQEQRDEKNKRTYIYHDFCFELAQDEIIKILMGQELYGEPALCLRELIQNALDALQLRDLHCQIKKENWFRPVDLPGPGEELKIKVGWGEEGGEKYILITDNGTGMTKEVIEQYFTQIGRSYYTSPSYFSEKEKLRRLLKESSKPLKMSTPISKFGIGILSCFMIADRIEVKTCPMQGGAQQLHMSEELLQPYDITICGPGSLFWLKEGTRKTCGTQVKLFLKKVKPSKTC